MGDLSTIALLFAVLAVAGMLRDVAVRAIAERRESRLARTSAAEEAAAKALAVSEENAKKVRELESRYGALLGRRERR